MLDSVKTVIEETVARGNFNTSELARSLNISPRMMRKYVLKCKLGISMRAASGRPPLLELDALAELKEFVSQNPDINDVELRKEIRRKVQEHWRKTHSHDIVTATAPKCRQGTVKYYCELLRNGENN